MRAITVHEYVTDLIDKKAAKAWGEQTEMHEAIARQGLDPEKTRLAFVIGYMRGFMDAVAGKRRCTKCGHLEQTWRIV